jgi:cell division protein FtsI/penicillin-binding protein 2
MAGAFALLAVVVLMRLLSYQILPQQRVIASPVTSRLTIPRGTVLDRDGELLIGEQYFYAISATPLHLDGEDRALIAATLSELIGLDRVEVEQLLLDNQERQFVLLARDVSLAQGEKVENFIKKLDDENRIPPFQYVHVSPRPSRYYAQGSLASHLLGFVDAERQGYYGVEGYYDRFLYRDGVGLQGKNPAGIEELAPNLRQFLPSVAGKDLILTIDRTIQWIAEEELQAAIKKYEAQSGSIIIMEPQTGAILGLANTPNFDPNAFGSVPFNRHTNPAISAQYEPGSIFKIFTMAAGLDTRVIAPSTVFTDSGTITLGGRIFFNSNRGAVGRLDATDALARSNNIVTVQVASRLGTERFYQYLQRFGFGQPTEIDLAGEVTGLLKFPGSEEWSLSDLGTNGFGQGLAVTPIQITAAAAAIANGGQLMRPHVVQTRIAGDKLIHTEPVVVRRTLDEQTTRALTEMMVEVVESGAPAAKVPGYNIAGKTGTAQIPTQQGYTEDETIVSFVGFAPADDPQFVILVKLDRPNPAISQWAAYTAAPTFAKVARRLFEHLNIPPDRVRQGLDLWR